MQPSTGQAPSSTSLLKHPQARGPSIVIIGAGVGGVSFAIALKRQLGFENFIIFEKGSEVGGTWRDNIYPGCSSDIGVHFYSLSTDLNPNWASTHGSQAEIQAYWKELSHKYSLYPHIIFNTRVLSAEWDSMKQLYTIVMENVPSGTTTSITAQILISAIGILNVPRFPNIPGILAFKGELFHSARWNTNVRLRGKRVAVIGNGTSATQFVPVISKDPSVHVTVFCRTPNYFMPPANSRAIFSYHKWAFANIPLCMRLYRFGLYLKTEMIYMVFGNSFIRRLVTMHTMRYLFNTAPARHHEKLTPNYPLGCKRVIFDAGYLPSLHRPNVDLNWDGINEIVEDGVVTKKGEKLPFDVVVCATGFVADEYPLLVRGRNGQSIQEYYHLHGGPSAYLGTSVPGFPNFYTVSGPNTATGHTSFIFTSEIQIDYCIQLVKPVVERIALSFEVTSEATDTYNKKLANRLAHSVFTKCTSWYRTGGDGKIYSIFPGPGILFWWWLRRPTWSHYNAVGAEKWTRQRRLDRVRMLIRAFFGVALFFSYLAWASPKVGTVLRPQSR